MRPLWTLLGIAFIAAILLNYDAFTPDPPQDVVVKPDPAATSTMLGHRRRCTRQLAMEGRWVYNESLKPRFSSRGRILGCCQRGFERLHGKGAQRPETSYEWTPSGCDLEPWSEESFCLALQGRSIMFAGDSLNDHWHATLAYLLGVSKDIYATEGTGPGKHACHTHPICGQYYPKPLRLYFLTNQLLREERCRGHNHNWWKHVARYPILVLNSGSWMRNPCKEEIEVSDEEYEEDMRRAMKLVRRQGFNGTLIWRTTYQGHPYCWTYTAPLDAPLRDDDFPRVPPYRYYRWWAITRRNAFATALWEKAGALILDVTRATNMMPLGHLGKFHPKNDAAHPNVSDCLHYCAPGAVYELWSRLLLNLLRGNL